MTLSPDAQDYPDWLGAYFTCRQLQQEMCGALQLQNALIGVEIGCSQLMDSKHPISVKRGSPHPLFGLVQPVIVNISIPGRESWFVSECSSTSSTLYGTWLNRLHIISDGQGDNGLWGGLKTLDARSLIKAARRGAVHCKEVTFTISRFARDQNHGLSPFIKNISSPVGASNVL